MNLFDALLVGAGAFLLGGAIHSGDVLPAAVGAAMMALGLWQKL